MKKLISAILVAASAALLFNPAAFAAPDAKSGAAAKAALKQRFKDNVGTSPNGDVYLKSFPDADFSKLKNTELVGSALLVFLSYVDPDLDFAALDKAILRETGGKKGSVPIKNIMAGIGKYLGRYNMQLQKIAVSGSSVNSKIDDGAPVIVWLKMEPADNIYDKIFLPRSAKRANFSDIDEWGRELRKSELKKFPQGRIFGRALIGGYNKKSGEYLVFGISKKPIWLTEKEVRGLMLEAYQLRY